MKHSWNDKRYEKNTNGYFQVSQCGQCKLVREKFKDGEKHIVKYYRSGNFIGIHAPECSSATKQSTGQTIQ